jgi:hypothetical protein
MPRSASQAGNRTGRQEIRDVTSAQETSALEDLVERYVSAYDAHSETPLSEQPREVWAGIPIRDEYNAVLTFVPKLHSTRGKFSDDNVESMVDDVLGDALNAPQCVGKFTRDLIGLVDEPLTTRLYIPLEGVELQPDEYRLGEIRLLNMYDAQFEELLIEPYRRSMLANKLYSDDFKQAGIVPRTAFPMMGESGPNLHKHENSVSWDAVLVCTLGASANVERFSQQNRSSGANFADRWRTKLQNAGVALGSGDFVNLGHAGALLAAFKLVATRIA